MASRVIDPSDRFSDSMRIIRNGTAPLVDQDLAQIPKYEVSTPQTRRAAIKDLYRQERVAAARRRRVLLVLLAGTQRDDRDLRGRTDPLVEPGDPRWPADGLCGRGPDQCGGDPAQPGRALPADPTRQQRVDDLPEPGGPAGRGSRDEAPASSRKSKKTDPAKEAGALWDPVPITVPTYVSKPLAPRTVRTIDLSGPGVTASARPQVPVTADAPEAVAEARAAGRRRRRPEGRVRVAGFASLTHSAAATHTPLQLRGSRSAKGS